MSDPVAKIQPELLIPNAKRREPFFGSGAGSLFAHLLTTAVGLLIFIGILFLGIQAKQMAQRFIYGEPVQTIPVLEPGQSTVIDGVKIKRIN